MSCLSEADVVFVAVEDFPDVLNDPDIANVLQYFCNTTHAFWIVFLMIFTLNFETSL